MKKKPSKEKKVIAAARTRVVKKQVKQPNRKELLGHIDMLEKQLEALRANIKGREADRPGVEEHNEGIRRQIDKQKEEAAAERRRKELLDALRHGWPARPDSKPDEEARRREFEEMVERARRSRPPLPPMTFPYPPVPIYFVIPGRPFHLEKFICHHGL